jgi:hypothetical protein
VFLAEVAVNVFSSFGRVRVADVVVGGGSRMPAVVAADMTKFLLRRLTFLSPSHL